MKFILLVDYSVLGPLLVLIVYTAFPVSPAAGRSSAVGLLPQSSLLLPAPTSTVFVLLLWDGSWQHWPQAFCKTMWGFFCAKGIFEAILPHSRKLWVKWAAAAGRWPRPCLGQLQKEHACISLRQSDFAASITRTLSSLSVSPSPTMHSFFISP